MLGRIAIFRCTDSWRFEQEFLGFEDIEFQTSEEFEKKASKVTERYFECDCDMYHRDDEDDIEFECSCSVSYRVVDPSISHYDEEEEEFYTDSQFREKKISEKENYVEILKNRNKELLELISNTRKRILENDEKIQKLKSGIEELSKEG